MLKRLIRRIRFRFDREYRAEFLRKENWTRIMMANEAIREGLNNKGR
jgi:hypothetical protein